MIDRIAAALLVLAGLLVSTIPEIASGDEIRYRKHVDDMSPAEWKALGDAISKLHESDAFGPQGPATPPQNEPFPQSHDSYEWFVQIHGNRKEAKACRHGSELIWPWHRAFLLHLENRLRATNPPLSSQITLPYWDWTERPSGTHGYPQAYEVSGSVFLHERTQYGTEVPLIVASDEIPQGMTPAQYVTKVLSGDWESFGGTADGPQGTAGGLETHLHNQIHGYIGDDNATTTHAVRDPIFWAHHAELDRLWDQWQKAHAGELQCFVCGAPVYDRDPQMGALTFNDVLSNDHLPGSVRVLYLTKGAPPPQPHLMALDEHHHAQPAAAMLLAPPNGVASYSFTVPATQSYRFQLRLVDLRVPVKHPYRTSVYLVPQNLAYAQTAEFRRHYRVDSFGVFANDDPDPEHNTQTITVDLTDAVRALPANAQGTSWKVVLDFRPADKTLSYANIAEEVSIGRVELLRRDFATRETILLK